MGFDLRQLVAGILTVTMFVMLGHMIKREHFDSVEDAFADGTDDEFNGVDKGISLYGKNSNGPWLEDSTDLTPCWEKTSFDEVEQTNGYVSFSLSNGPEYHVSQVADAVVVARYLGATLVLPDVRGSTAGDRRKFEEIYDVEKFIKSLEGVVKVVEDLPAEVSIRDIVVAKVPNRVSEEHIAEQVEPLYKKKKNIRLATYFSSVNMRKFSNAVKSNSDSVACLGMFGTLKLKDEINETVDHMMERLKALGKSNGGRFVAVDLRVEMLENKGGCHEGGSSVTKSCYTAQEIGVFLRKIGFNKDTAIYLTQSRWVDSLDVLKNMFPRTYTKESLLPPSKQAKFMDSEDSEMEKVLDFYICSQSDVFVPAISGLFYANVVGQRIANGKTEVLVPATIAGKSAVFYYHFSPYISKKSHLAYSCFC